MKITLAQFAVSAALGAALTLGVAAPASASTPGKVPGYDAAQAPRADPAGNPVLLADNDSDDEEDDDNRGARGGEDDDDDDCEGSRTCAPGQNAAPAGTVTPPANGLFSPGAAPQVRVN